MILKSYNYHVSLRREQIRGFWRSDAHPLHLTPLLPGEIHIPIIPSAAAVE